MIIERFVVQRRMGSGANDRPKVLVGLDGHQYRTTRRTRARIKDDGGIQSGTLRWPV